MDHDHDLVITFCLPDGFFQMMAPHKESAGYEFLASLQRKRGDILVKDGRRWVQHAVKIKKYGLHCLMVSQIKIYKHRLQGVEKVGKPYGFAALSFPPLRASSPRIGLKACFPMFEILDKRHPKIKTIENFHLSIIFDVLRYHYANYIYIKTDARRPSL